MAEGASILSLLPEAKKIFETSSWLYQNWAFIPEGIEIREQKAGGGARKRKKGETERGLNIFLILPAKNEKRSRFEIRMSWLALAFDEAYFFSAFSWLFSAFSWLLTIVTFYLYFMSLVNSAFILREWFFVQSLLCFRWLFKSLLVAHLVLWLVVIANC